MDRGRKETVAGTPMSPFMVHSGADNLCTPLWLPPLPSACRNTGQKKKLAKQDASPHRQQWRKTCPQDLTLSHPSLRKGLQSILDIVIFDLIE